MNVIIAHHQDNRQEDVTSLRRFFQLAYQGDVSFGTPSTTPINIIWLENIWWGCLFVWWGCLFAGIFLFMVPTSFFCSLACGLFSYLIMGSCQSLFGFMGFHYLVKFLMYLAGTWIWGLFIPASILGGYLWAVGLAIMEGDFSRSEKSRQYQDEYVCFEIYSQRNHSKYIVTDCFSTFLLKWKTSYDYHIGIVVKGLYLMIQQYTYNNDPLPKKQ